MAGGPLASVGPYVMPPHAMPPQVMPPQQRVWAGQMFAQGHPQQGQACLKAPRELVATLMGCLKELGRLRTHRTGSQVSLSCPAGCYIQGYSDTRVDRSCHNDPEQLG